MNEIHVLEVGADVIIGDGIHRPANACVLEMVVVAIDVVRLLHTNAARTDEEITVGDVVVAIAENHHRILVVHEGVEAQHIFHGLDGDRLPHYLPLPCC